MAEFLKNEQLGRPDLETYQGISKLNVVVILDNVRSGLNVGSIFRSSDAFLVEKIMLCGITAKPPEKEIIKSALGATESVAWEYFNDTMEVVQVLKKSDYKIFAIEQSDSGTTLENLTVSSDQKYALIFGNEVKGVDEKLLPFVDGCIEIPQSGIKHSLNISVCAGIVLWKFYEFLHLAK
jgi:tRNA G18 (ribose-2'-O)-methylase SpoU